jgi:alpha-glucoside transport system substrate-binding protein
MNRKTLMLTSLMSLIALALGACAPAATPTLAPTQAPTLPPTTMPTEAATQMPTQMPTEAPTTAAGGIDCMGATSGEQLTLMYQWSGAEEESFNSIIKPFVDACGVTINAQSTRDPAVLDTAVKSTPPDVLFWPSLAPMNLYTAQLKPLDTVGGDQSNYKSFWVDLGTKDGKWLTIPAKADVKSIIWYSPAQFAALGYQVPTTFDDLKTLVDKMAADGNVPWSMGTNNGGAGDGWPGTDFIQDILLATKGTDYVNGILTGSTPYNDQGIIDAYTLYHSWASDPKYAAGGSDGTVNTPFLDSIYKVFQPTPEAMMVKISGFAGGEIAKQFPNLKYGTDYDFFEFPGVQGLQGGADFMYAFSDSPAAKALIAYITSTEGGKNWAAANFSLSPNNGAAGNYTDPQSAKLGDILAGATGFTFDVGDGLGDPFSTAEFKAVVDVVQGADIATTLKTVADAQTATLNKQ